MPPAYQCDTDYVIEYLYNQLDTEEDDHEFGKIFDHYLKNDVLFLRVRYIGDTLGKYNIIDVPLITLKKDVPIELVIYVNSYIFESSGRKGV